MGSFFLCDPVAVGPKQYLLQGMSSKEIADRIKVEPLHGESFYEVR
jgi:hypothetical protein